MLGASMTTDATTERSAPGGTAEISLPIAGMTCASCVNRIDRFLRAADGVSEVSVNLATESATIRYLPERTGAADLARVVDNPLEGLVPGALLGGRRLRRERDGSQEDGKGGQTGEGGGTVE